MHPAALVTISFCFRGQWGGGQAVLLLFFLIPHLVFPSKYRLRSLVFQVFVNFAREQHAEDDCHAYDNRVDTADELPLRPVHEEEKV